MIGVSLVAPILPLYARQFGVSRTAAGALISSFAVARLLSKRIIPVAVITNGDDAVIMDAVSGKTLAEGLAAIPTRDRLKTMLETSPDYVLSSIRREKEKRILFAMEILTRKECETYICRDSIMR